MRQTPDGLMVTSWYRVRYIEILCGPKWYCWRSQRIFSVPLRIGLGGLTVRDARPIVQTLESLFDAVTDFLEVT